MAALDRLFDDAPREPRDPDRVRVVAPVLPLLPMLPQPDEPRLEQRPHRHLSLSELDGPDYEFAVDAADAYQQERDATLYGAREDVQIGWTKEVA